MFVQEISIEIKVPRINRTELYENMQWFVSALQRNGQSQGGGVEPVYFCGNRLTAVVCTLEKSSLLSKNDNVYVKKGRYELEEMCQSKFRVKTLGKNLWEDKRLCRCKKPSSYILWTNYISLVSPLDCGDCGGNVPLYRVPKPPEPGEQEYQSIRYWEHAYQACDQLQMLCGFGERWGTRQMQDHDSGLSKLGRDVCVNLEEMLGVPVYYYLYNNRALTMAQDKERKCPECGGDWLLEESWHRLFAFRCDKCRLVSNITWNSRYTERT
jgi:predicted  nucleic acid-binding Zn ribbon protein